MLRAATFAALLVSMGLGLGLAVAQQPAPAPAVTMDDIKKAWQDRQDKVKTLKMSWKRTVTEARGSLDALVGRFRDKKIQTPQPPTDTRLFGQSTFTLANDCFRHDSVSETWSLPDQAKQKYATTALYDGHDYRRKEGVETADKDQMSIQSKKQALDLELLELKPLWWCARGSRNFLGESALDEYELTGRVVTIRGLPCLELEAKNRAAGTLTRLMLEGTTYLPIHYSKTRANRPTCQMDIEYKNLTTANLPDKWRYVISDSSGRTRESLDATATLCEVNASLDENTFRPTARPGSMVLDLTKEREQVALVLPDGTISQSAERQSVRSFDDLVEVTKPRTNRWWWFGGAMGALVVATRYSRRRPPTAPVSPPNPLRM